jgi:hypothetical protein
MNASIATPPHINGVSVHPATMPDAGQWWTEIDGRLSDMGEPNAAWLEELAPLYASCVSVREAVRIVLVGRRVK